MGDVIVGVLLGALAREWFALLVMGLNWMRHRRHLHKIIDANKQSLSRMRAAGLIDDYEIMGWDLTGPNPICNVSVGSKRALRDFRVIRTEEPENADPT